MGSSSSLRVEACHGIVHGARQYDTGSVPNWRLVGHMSLDTTGAVPRRTRSLHSRSARSGPAQAMHVLGPPACALSGPLGLGLCAHTGGGQRHEGPLVADSCRTSLVVEVLRSIAVGQSLVESDLFIFEVYCSGGSHM